MTPSSKHIKILLKLIGSPYVYNQTELAKATGMTRDNVHDAIKAFKEVNLKFEQEKGPPYKCAILSDGSFKELQKLLHLNDNDRGNISRALNATMSSKEVLYINKKLDSLYDFQKLGIRSLRKPELDKLDTLERSIKLKKQVTLKNYRSNSNDISDRKVECFLTNAKAGMIQVYDPDKNDTRHFKLSRIERVVIEDDDWLHEKSHEKKEADVFRIADNETTSVHLKLNVYSYNSMLDLFPESLSRILPSNEENCFDFQAEVNHKFLGLIPFILSNASNIEILSPDSLAEDVKKRAQQVLDHFSGE